MLDIAFSHAPCAEVADPEAAAPTREHSDRGFVGQVAGATAVADPQTHGTARVDDQADGVIAGGTADLVDAVAAAVAARSPLERDRALLPPAIVAAPVDRWRLARLGPGVS
jgi:hypothetical protein